MVDNILKSQDQAFSIFRWNTAIILFMKKCHMDRRRYKSRHLIPMFIKTPCTFTGGGGVGKSCLTTRMLHNKYMVTMI